ncbi:RNA-binding protein [candidate division TA06 bacterium DG_26]|uniref:RNA-binding protein KhpA n=1 Tax=candidate division TA06 bacterium DG_26 TaxID=1703771 RepID=A0A0S7WIL0_UNCT6|nr:MAG: RNA-binding protein [candidate division TA06 bacterium DG_26]
MRELIEEIAKALVDHPDSVDVKEIEGGKTVVYELRVGAGDMGKIVGRGGKTVDAIRTIVTAASMKKGKRAIVEIVE